MVKPRLNTVTAKEWRLARRFRELYISRRLRYGHADRIPTLTRAMQKNSPVSTRIATLLKKAEERPR
ncbi:hypothetical protein D3C76_1615980 [compost metagenome]